MAFCTFSKEYNSAAFTGVENVFIYAYMPECGESALKVYLYGLYLCHGGRDYSLKETAEALNMQESDVRDCFRYWEEFGLCEIVSDDPFEVNYLPIGLSGAKPRKINAEKYSEFNRSLQKIVSGRMITTAEFSEYFRIMETYNVRQEAMLMIAQYCVDLKGDDIGYRYVSAVAKDFAARGVTTPEKVEKELQNYVVRSKEIAEILSALGAKRKPEVEDATLFAKWTAELGFEPAAIVAAASALKRGSMKKLDEFIMELYANKKFDVKEIAEFSKSRKYLYELAVRINKQLSVYYELIDPVVSEYTSRWVAMGYTEEALLFIADFCFRHNKRDLGEMDELLKKLHGEGVIDIDGVADYFRALSGENEFLRKVLENLALTRRPNEWDRNNLSRWRSWGFTDELILFAAEVSNGKSNPTVYMNAVLGSWKNNGVFTLEEAKKTNKVPDFAQKRSSTHFAGERKYTKEQLDAIITDVDDLEI